MFTILAINHDRKVISAVFHGDSCTCTEAAACHDCGKRLDVESTACACRSGLCVTPEQRHYEGPECERHNIHGLWEEQEVDVDVLVAVEEEDPETGEKKLVEKVIRQKAVAKALLDFRDDQKTLKALREFEVQWQSARASKAVPVPAAVSALVGKTLK